MQIGMPPYTKSYSSGEVLYEQVELHHLIQSDAGSFAEVPAITIHDKYNRVLHMYGSSVERPSEFMINRTWFNKFRNDYWINRAKDFTISK